MYDFDTELASWHTLVRSNLASIFLQKFLLILSKITKMKNIWLSIYSLSSINDKNEHWVGDLFLGITHS